MSNKVIHECIECGVEFCLSAEMDAQRLSDKKLFYCTNGHSQCYVGENDRTKLKRAEKRIKSLLQTMEYTSDANRDLREDNEYLRRSRGYYTGRLTSLRESIQAQA